MARINGTHALTDSVEDRIVDSLEDIARLVGHLKGLGSKIVLTSGSFDLIHLGHVKYLAKAKELGDVLVVGVDSDAKIRRRKGPDRPMVPEEERLALLAYQRPVDLAYLKSEDEARWALIKAVEPDVLVVTEDHPYDDAEQRALLEFCGRIEVLERQASVTTSERIRQMYMHLGDRLGPKLADVLPGLIDSILKQR
ncbi:MAG TPA: adenylyltransferase/cytidyltransferase family protein [Solirubrobacteraceae bacterium]|jgi:D-beta-D-heptose 7-phosphate kinase/D-beta-D-heptose 1-phosphate adenosyltransferase